MIIGTRHFFIIIGFLFLAFASDAQSPLLKRTDFTVNDELLEDALIQLSQQTAVNISFSNKLIPSKKRVTTNQKNTTIQRILDILLTNTNIQYKVIGDNISLSKRPPPPSRKFTISGYVEDEETGEPLIGANIYDPDSQLGTSTNEYGFFSLTLYEAINIELDVSFLGYQLKKEQLKLKKDLQVNIQLAASLTLNPIIVTPQDSLYGTAANLNQYNDQIAIEQIKLLPTLGGEADIWRGNYLQAGVQTGTDGVGGLLVRGGSVDQNLVLLDGVPVYNPTHAIGVFSIFNTDAIKSFTLYKGNAPARYGGRLSSVMNIRTREGNNQEFSGEVSAGLISAKASFEGPIIKDKCSFFISGRHSLTQWYIPQITSRVKDQNNENRVTGIDQNRSGSSDYAFYDINAKLHVDVSPKDKFYLSYYKGNDDFSDRNLLEYRDSFSFNIDPPLFIDATIRDTTDLGFSWGNTATSLRWNHVFTNKLFANTTLYYSDYNFQSEERFASGGFYEDGSDDYILEVEKFTLNNNNLGGKIDLDYIHSTNHYIRFGLGVSKQEFLPGAFLNSTEAIDLPILLDSIAIFDTLDVQPQIAYEYEAYIEDDFQLTSTLQANIGVRGAIWSIDNTNFYSLQPRIHTTYNLRKNWLIRADFSQSVQHVHFLTKSNLGLPGDIWVPTTQNVPPERAWQTSLGVEYQIKKFGFVSIDAYYKDMNNVIAFIQGDSSLVLNATNWEENVEIGQGEAYGVEFSLKKTSGMFRSWVNYTLSWSERQFDNLNDGQPFPFRYDRRHSLKLMGQYFLGDHWNFNATWVIESGARLTLPLFEYQVRTGFGDINIQEPSQINERQTPAYHRLDIAANYSFEKGRWSHALSLGIFNVYNRINPIFYRLRQDQQLVQVSLLPFLPSVNYSVKF